MRFKSSHHRRGPRIAGRLLPRFAHEKRTGNPNQRHERNCADRKDWSTLWLRLCKIDIIFVIEDIARRLEFRDEFVVGRKTLRRFGRDHSIKDARRCLGNFRHDLAKIERPVL